MGLAQRMHVSFDLSQYRHPEDPMAQVAAALSNKAHFRNGPQTEIQAAVTPSPLAVPAGYVDTRKMDDEE